MSRYPEQGQDGFPDGFDFLGVRMKISVVGFGLDFKSLKVNDGKGHDNKAKYVEITKLTLMHKSGGIEIEFPYKYNVGSFNNNDNKETRKLMFVLVHGIDEEEGYMYIDFLFERNMLKPMDYIVYDPNVKVVEVPAGWGEESNAVAMAPAVNFLTMVLLGFSAAVAFFA